MHLRKLLNDLEKGLDSSVEESVGMLHQTLKEHIYEASNAMIPQAVNNAVPTAEGWGAHRSQGGLPWYVLDIITTLSVDYEVANDDTP